MWYIGKSMLSGKSSSLTSLSNSGGKKGEDLFVGNSCEWERESLPHGSSNGSSEGILHGWILFSCWLFPNCEWKRHTEREKQESATSTQELDSQKKNQIDSTIVCCVSESLRVGLSCWAVCVCLAVRKKRLEKRFSWSGKPCPGREWLLFQLFPSSSCFRCSIFAARLSFILANGVEQKRERRGPGSRKKKEEAGEE